MVQTLDNLLRTLNGCCKPASFFLPAANAVHFLRPTSSFRFEFLAMLAHAFDLQRCHDKLRAACFTCAVFPIAVLSEVIPFEIATLKLSLVVKAHFVTAFPVSTVLK